VTGSVASGGVTISDDHDNIVHQWARDEETGEWIDVADPNNTADVSLFLGQQLGDAGAVRDSYKAATAALAVADKAGRTAAKIAAREATPTLVVGVIQGVRPSTGPAPGSDGRANVTDAAADGLGQTMKIGGRILVVAGVAYDVVRISTSDDPVRTTFQASFGWGGATLGGIGFAALGTFAAPGPGTIVGGLGGAMGGSMLGEKVGGAVYDAVTSPAAQNYYMSSPGW